MSGLVHQLQSDAINSDVSVSNLLRKVKLTASKLSLNDVAGWVEQELKGYGAADLPEYRKIRGTAQAFNPYRGWVPIVGDPGIVRELSVVHVSQSIASLEALLAGEDGEIHFPYDPRIVANLSKSTGLNWGRMSCHVDRSQLVSIIDAVRNAVLDWAIELEKSGVSGEGLYFSTEEKSVAKSYSSINIQKIDNFNGPMGFGNTVRDINVGVSNVKKMQVDVARLKSSIRHLVEAGANEEELAPAVELLFDEVRKSEPDASRISVLLSDIRSAISGAAGNLVAEGALKLIENFGS